MLKFLYRIGLFRCRIKSAPKIISLGPWWWSGGQNAHLPSDALSSNPAEAYSFFCKICV